MTPIQAPLAQARPNALRAALLAGEKMEDTAVILRTTFSQQGDDIVIRIPRTTAFSNLRVKDEIKDGKPLRSATLVINAMADDKADLLMSFPDATTGKVVQMPCKPSINVNLGMVWRQAKVAEPTIGQRITAIVNEVQAESIA